MSDGLASVIIPVWNGKRYLAQCISAVLAQEDVDCEIIAVDNASSDGSADWVAATFPAVRLIRHGQNLGFSGGCNAGLKAASGDVLVLLNQDARVCPGWLSALRGALEDPRVGVAGCRVLYPDGETLQHAGGRIEWPLGLARHDGQGELTGQQWAAPRQVEYVTGAAMAFRRDVMDRVGLLDEGFWPGYFEDADYCFRVREGGYEVWYIPDAAVIHEETTSLTQPAALARAYERGRLRFTLKHTSPRRFLESFVPAERDYQMRMARGPGGDSLRMAYLEAIPAAASILARRWQADVETIDQVLLALQQLYRAPRADSISLIPALQEFEFRSSLPVIGPVIARLRSLWYSVAARWAIRSLIEQQEAINQQQDVYARSLLSLSQEVARLIHERGSGPDGSSGQGPRRQDR